MGVVPALFSATMSVPVLLFASYADAFGGRRVDVAVEPPCTVAELLQVMRTLPGGQVLPVAPLVALNHSWVTAEHRIAVGDEVAVIPPVAGG